MISMSSTSAFSYRLLLLSATILVVLSQQVTRQPSSTKESTCTSEDLSHSILVECSSFSCGPPPSTTSRDGSQQQEAEWPSNPNEAIHVFSSRAGDRLKQVKLANIDHLEDDRTRIHNINTTLYVKTKSSDGGLTNNKLAAFGATLHFGKLAKALESGQFERLYGLVFDDLFGSSAGSSANLDLLRLRLDSDFFKQQHDLPRVLAELDNQAKKCTIKGKKRIRLLFELDNLADVIVTVESVASVLPSLGNTRIWALSIENSAFNWVSSELLQPIIQHIRQELPGVQLFISVLDPQDAPDLIDRIRSGGYQIPAGTFQGLLMKAQPSTPYNLLKYVRDQAPRDFTIMTLASDRSGTKDYGDWQNGQDSAIELMNHLKYGSNGYIEHQTLLEVLERASVTSAYHDAALYSLHESHGLHFKGPKFYALAHFSRYLPGSWKMMRSLPLEVELFTQSNMFAAHYSAFMLTSEDPLAESRHIVVVVSNENEHLLPFRVAVERRVMLAAYLEPKSLNTFLMKLS